MKTMKSMKKFYQAGAMVYYGVKVYKAHQTKGLLKDNELTELLAEVIIKRMTPIVAEMYGIDMTNVTYSWGETCPYFYIGMADAITSKFDTGEIHVHYFTDRLTKKGTAIEPIYSIQDYAYGIAEIITHELCHVKQFQNGLNTDETPTLIYEIPAYTMGVFGYMKYKKEIKAILNGLGL